LKLQDVEASGRIRLRNPPELGFLGLFIVLATVCLLFGAQDISEGRLLPSLVMLLPGVFLATIAISRDLFYRATWVTVLKTGIVLEFRYSRPRNVPWNEIEYVMTERQLGSVQNRSGHTAMKLRRVKSAVFPISYDIASEVREAFLKENGRHPMTREEFRKWKAGT
jgi:hypothetical protein